MKRFFMLAVFMAVFSFNAWALSVPSFALSNLDFKVVDSVMVVQLSGSACGIDLLVEPATCGQFNGAIDLDVFIGQPPYNYQWSNGATTEDLNNLGAGTYTVTFSDASGCSAIAAASVYSVGGNFSIIVDQIDPAGCTNMGNAWISVTPNGQYNHNWSNGATTPYLDWVYAGNYGLTVADSYGCTKTISVTIPGAIPPYSYADPENATCGLSNGSIDLNVNSGQGPFTYLWSNGATTEDISNLSSGTYTVTVTESSGYACTSTASATVLSSPGISLFATASEASCGQASGSIDLMVSGGTPGFIYLWSNGFTGEDPSGLPAGTYTVTVTDAANCTAVTSVTVNGTSAPVLNVLITNATCGLTNGSVNLTVVGGTPDYTYNWSNGATTEDLNNLGAGTYAVTVTDAAGCTAKTTATVGGGGSVNPAISGDTLYCEGGFATLTASGGVSYKWSNGQTGATTSGTAGTYTVTVTDANGCTGTASVTVTELPAPDAAISGPAGVCDGGNVTLTASGGGTYLWNGLGLTTPSVSVPPGTYMVVVTSTNGCTATATHMVQSFNAPNPPVIDFTETDCATVVSVVGSYVGYQWSNGETGQSFEVSDPGLNGPWSVTVTDANGCTAEAATCTRVFIPECAVDPVLPPVASFVASPGGCAPAFIVFTPDTLNIDTYFWDFGDGVSVNQQNAVHTYQSPGNYTVTLTVTNSAGQSTATLDVVIDGPPTAAFGFSADGLVVEFDNQTIGATSYSWNFDDGSDPSTEQHPVHTFPCTGTYYVTLTATNDCGSFTAIATVVVEEVAPISSDYIFADHGNWTPLGTGADACVGETLVLTATEGSAQNSLYLWSPSGSNYKSVEFVAQWVGLNPIQCQVTNPATGNTNVYNFTVEVKQCVSGTSDDRGPDDPILFPNPTLGPVNVDLSGLPAAIYFIPVLDEKGRIVVPAQRVVKH